ncbi:hypothetical protein [Microbacterium luticocti]|uniref:hypothetical protein n=1 Tax=Microbacterium luticocti TaxID=451764 RepID=UPI00040DBE64|nr:hypothetical protein [Microbacterium luticocti]
MRTPPADERIFMTVPSATPPRTDVPNSKLLRAAIWVAIGALIAAAIVCVVMVLVGTANGIVPRAFLTILLMVAFAGVTILDTYLAPRRPAWFALTSMVVWVITLLIGAVLIWMPFRMMSLLQFGGGAGRFFSFLLIVLILQLAVLHVRLYTKAWARNRTTFTNIVAWITIVLVALLALMLVLPLMLKEWVHFRDLYWRLTVAVAILAAVGTALVPLMNALFAPRETRPHPHVPGWPTYADGVTPLPVLGDGQPDWNAYYVGRPTTPTGWAAPEPAPAVAPPHATVPVTDAAAPAHGSDMAGWPPPTIPSAAPDASSPSVTPDWPAPVPPQPQPPMPPQPSPEPPPVPEPAHPFPPEPAPPAPQPPAPGTPEPPIPGTPEPPMPGAPQPPAPGPQPPTPQPPAPGPQPPTPGPQPPAPGFDGYPAPPAPPHER